MLTRDRDRERARPYTESDSPAINLNVSIIKRNYNTFRWKLWFMIQKHAFAFSNLSDVGRNKSPLNASIVNFLIDSNVTK